MRTLFGLSSLSSQRKDGTATQGSRAANKQNTTRRVFPLFTAHSSMKHQGSCSCGSVQIGIDTDPFLVYNCHCSHCRKFASKPYDDDASAAPAALYHHGAGVWRWNVCVSGNGSNSSEVLLDYEETTATAGLFAMSRGRCRQCKDPVVEWCHRLVAPFCMVACEPFIGQLKPADTTNIFYDSGLFQGTNGLRTIHTDLGSLLYEVYIILIVAIPSLPRSIWARLSRKALSPLKKRD